MHENAIVAIPCHNEEANVSRTIHLVKSTGFSGKILVIDDGSTDHTARIAQENGAEVIRMPKNVGKAGAIFAAFKEGIKRNCDALLTLDADMHEIPKREFDLMIEDARKNTTEGKTMMIVAYTKERSGIMWLSADISGIRAYSKNALLKVNHSKDKGKVKGFGIEQFLNLELGGRTTSKGFMSNFVAGPTLRQGERQSNEIQQTLHSLRKRVRRTNEERLAQLKERIRLGQMKWQQPLTPEDEALMKAIRKKALAAKKRAVKRGFIKIGRPKNFGK